MKNFLILCAAAWLAAACGRTAPRPQGDRTAPAHASQEAAARVGGYTGQRPLSESERQLFEAVVAASSKEMEYTPESVATQVVAGTNYRFVCTAAGSEPHAPKRKVEIIVFRPLPGRGDPRITEIRDL